MAKYVVTGATGFLGANLVRALLREGHDVQCVIRKPNRLVEGLSIGLHTIPLVDQPSAVRDLAKLMEGADGVYHLAGIFDPSPEGLSRMTQLHIFGTRAILRAAEQAKVGRIVHCSSSITVGFSDRFPDPAEPCENWSIDPNKIYGASGALRHYYNTKKQSEDLVLGWEGLDTVVVNPDYILGPWDVKPTSGQMILSLCKGRLPFYPTGGKCFLGADDCADAHIAAMERGACGERYLLGAHNLTYRDLLRKAAEIAGVSFPRFAVPKLGTQVLSVLGKPLIATDPHRFAGLDAHVLNSMQENRFRTGAKMVAELGIEPKPIEDAIEGTIRWFKEFGYC
jgi:dihydroflavonol-4-reductase